MEKYRRRAVPRSFFKENLTAAEMRRNILILAWPSVANLALQTLVGMFTMMIIGSLGPAAIAAVGLGNLVIFIMIGVLAALSVGTTALVARRIGSGRVGQAEEVLRQSLLAGVLVAGVLSAVVFMLAERLIDALMLSNHDRAVIGMATLYLRYVSLSMIVGVLLFMINGALEGAGDTRTPLYIMIVVNLVNLAGALLLVRGLGPFPALGFKGAALAAVVARVLGSALAVGWVAGPYSVLRLRWQGGFRPDWSTIRQVLDIGLPASGEQLARLAAQTIYTVFIVNMGTWVLAAHQITANVNSLAMLPGTGFAVAATTLVGQSLGAGSPEVAARYARETNKLGTLLMASIAALFGVFTRPFVSLYTTDPQVIALAVSTVRIVAVASIPFSIVLITSGSLRGAGDTRFVLYTTVAGQWGIRLALTFALALGLGWGLEGVWVAMLLDLVIRAGIVRWRFASGAWRTVFARQEARYDRRGGVREVDLSGDGELRGGGDPAGLGPSGT
ncbi:MAG TPA: MATE family efflux transporter [Firmicutes bacterium]|nr:MATE family efflux transporter [Bacillota bacterium]